MSEATREPAPRTDFTFGESALATPANAVTVARLLAAPVYVLMLIAWGASWVNVVVGFLLAASDGLDGYMARRHGTTRSGAFLDPLADKACVLGAMITLAAQGHLPWLPVVLITAREVGMQVYRSWVARRGVSIPARKSAKLKTLVQDLAIGAVIIPPLAHQHTLQVVMIWFACALTLYTGAEYLFDGRRVLHGTTTPKVAPVRIEIVAVGTELLLGQIADTNSAWLGEHLAANGVASHFHQAVGDNHDRITLALRTALARSDGVIMCGGLGPTQDDITREAIAEVMNVPLVRDQAIVDVIAGFFEGRGRTMTDNNARQADVPQGAAIIPQVAGTAPGLICPVGNKVVYAVPGVPYEMAEMFERGILPDLRARMAESGEETGVIASRVLRTWGASESGLAESLQDRIDALGSTGDVTLAFLASGIEGIKVRITARARTTGDVTALLDKEDAEVRRAIEDRLGDIVFGVDDESMEVAVASRLIDRGLTFGVAESLTGGLIASRLVNVAGASSWFRGGVVAYDSQVKFDVLGVPVGPVVTEAAAAAMAEGAARVTGADVGLGITGVAGPDDQEGVAPGTVFVGLHLPRQPAQTRELRVPGDRERVRQYGAISALDLLRRALDASAA